MRIGARLNESDGSSESRGGGRSGSVGIARADRGHTPVAASTGDGSRDTNVRCATGQSRRTAAARWCQQGVDRAVETKNERIDVRPLQREGVIPRETDG